MPDVKTIPRFKVMLMHGERSWTVEESDYCETQIRLSKLIVCLLGDVPGFSLKRIIENERDISRTFSFEFDLNVLEREKTALFAVQTYLPLELSPDSPVSLTLGT